MPKPGTAKTASGHRFIERNWRWLLLDIIFLASFILVLLPHQSSCQESYAVDKKITANKATINSQVVITGQALEKGLGGKACIGQNQAMLFVFDKPGYYPFWMKDMRFSIDMVWIDSDKKVVYIQPNVAPNTYPQTFVSTRPAKYVLEVKTDQTVKDGLQPVAS